MSKKIEETPRKQLYLKKNKTSNKKKIKKTK